MEYVQCDPKFYPHHQVLNETSITHLFILLCSPKFLSAEFRLCDVKTALLIHNYATGRIIY